MRSNAIKEKVFISGGLMILLMFVHLTGIVETCERQVTNSPSAVSAFNG